METLFITGGAGFIGSHLVDRIISEGAQEVIVIDNLFTGDEKNLEKESLRSLLFCTSKCNFCLSSKFC